MKIFAQFKVSAKNGWSRDQRNEISRMSRIIF